MAQLQITTTKCVFLLFLVRTCCAVQHIGKVYPGFNGTQEYWTDHDGIFLLSNDTNFGFGLKSTRRNVNSLSSSSLRYLLVVIHMSSSTVVWSANRDSPVTDRDTFSFDDTGNVYVRSKGSLIWATDSGNKGVIAMELRDSGNLVLLGNDGNLIWQSFDYPTDTLLSNQKFLEGMKLTSEPGSNNLSYSLEIKSGDMILSADFEIPRPYWSLGNDDRVTISKGFITTTSNENVTSATVIANSWNFYDRNDVLLSQFIFSDNTDATATWAAVLGNDGSVTFIMLQGGSPNLSPMRIPEDGRNKPSEIIRYCINQRFPIVVILSIVIETLLVVSCMMFAGLWVYKKNSEHLARPKNNCSDEDIFFEGLSGMPLRFTYKDLQTATCNFSVKLGQGGFGSVYDGTLPDGTRLAVKKLEGIGQGKKEFGAEVSIIGSIHHLHLVRLRGFCAEGSHRLLAYEYMSNGSLDRWLFPKDKEGTVVLDWDTRYDIAIGTAKGLTYLHEDCDAKIVHCDVKPENVLLDDQFKAKVSDFGLAKLMNREQSHVFTTLRGTRGYVAPEWITNYAISEKSDVYSYGMVLLELIAGRKNYDANESPERSHFPSHAFKMLEEGNIKDIVDARLEIDYEEDTRVEVAIRVALWCIQDDMNLRPSMAKVVQMLEGLCSVPLPPIASPPSWRSVRELDVSSLRPSDCNSDVCISTVRLSGPR